MAISATQGAGGKAARLKHDDAAGDAGQQCQRHTRRLARAGRCHQHGTAMGGNRGGQVGQYGVDGQFHSGLMAKSRRFVTT